MVLQFCSPKIEETSPRLTELLLLIEKTSYFQLGWERELILSEKTQLHLGGRLFKQGRDSCGADVPKTRNLSDSE